MRDHGGDLDRAIRRFGGAPADWIDLSTGINRRPYPVPPLPDATFRALPTEGALRELVTVARAAWGIPAGGSQGAETDGGEAERGEADGVEANGAKTDGAKTGRGDGDGANSQTLALAGAQAAIQAIPRLAAPGRARVLAPTYNEYAHALGTAGWQVEEVAAPEDLAGADLAILANPNNPDGRRHAPDALRRLAGRVGRLVVDESFVDCAPDLSLLAAPLPANLLVLRSFGKFHGLAGLRLGFVTGAPGDIAALRALVGPWPVSGPAIAIGRVALADAAWSAATRLQVARDAARLDRAATAAGWSVAGGTTLFRLYATPDAEAARAALAAHRIWSRIFPWSPGLLRLGLPGPEGEWHRVEAALSDRGGSGTRPAATSGVW